MAQQILSTNTFGVAKWIVSATAYDGTHTTIAGALTSASSGDTIFIRPGTFTENLTLKAGVNITSFTDDGLTPTVTIIGTCTMTVAGTASISGIRLQTNSANAIAVTGTAASILNLDNCYLNFTNNSGISYTSSDATSRITLTNCRGDLGTTGIALHVSTSAGLLTYNRCSFTNTGSSLTASSTSTGEVDLKYSMFNSIFSTTSSGTVIAQYCQFAPAGLNIVPLTTAGTGVSALEFCAINSGTASAVSIGTGTTVSIENTRITSSNTNAVTGAGTVVYGPITFDGTSSLINTTTQTLKDFGPSGTFTPTVVGVVAGTTTYTNQNGYYKVVGKIVYIDAIVATSAATGTGNLTFGGLPFTVSNVTLFSGRCSCLVAGMTWPVGTTTTCGQFVLNSTTALISCTGTTTGNNFLQMANVAFTIRLTGFYFVD